MGVVSGVLVGVFSDIGVDDNFMWELGEIMCFGSLVLFVLVKKVIFDKVLVDVSKYGGKVLRIFFF